MTLLLLAAVGYGSYTATGVVINTVRARTDVRALRKMLNA